MLKCSSLYILAVVFVLSSCLGTENVESSTDNPYVKKYADADEFMENMELHVESFSAKEWQEMLELNTDLIGQYYSFTGEELSYGIILLRYIVSARDVPADVLDAIVGYSVNTLGVDLNQEQRYSATVMYWASFYKNYELLRTAIRYGGRIDDAFAETILKLPHAVIFLHQSFQDSITSYNIMDRIDMTRLLVSDNQYPYGIYGNFAVFDTYVLYLIEQKNQTTVQAETQIDQVELNLTRFTYTEEQKSTINAWVAAFKAKYTVT